MGSSTPRSSHSSGHSLERPGSWHHAGNWLLLLSRQKLQIFPWFLAVMRLKCGLLRVWRDGHMLKQRGQPFFNLSAAYGTAKIHHWTAFLQKGTSQKGWILRVCQRGPRKRVIWSRRNWRLSGWADSSFVRSYTFSSAESETRCYTHIHTRTHTGGLNQFHTCLNWEARIVCLSQARRSRWWNASQRAYSADHRGLAHLGELGNALGFRV